MHPVPNHEGWRLPGVLLVGATPSAGQADLRQWLDSGLGQNKHCQLLTGCASVAQGNIKTHPPVLTGNPGYCPRHLGMNKRFKNLPQGGKLESIMVLELGDLDSFDDLARYLIFGNLSYFL